MQVERLQELGFCLAARSTSREWLFNDLFSESTRMGGGQKSGIFKRGPCSTARISAKFRKLFLPLFDADLAPAEWARWKKRREIQGGG
jgi:hypothetical protein